MYKAFSFEYDSNNESDAVTYFKTQPWYERLLNYFTLRSLFTIYLLSGIFLGFLFIVSDKYWDGQFFFFGLNNTVIHYPTITAFVKCLTGGIAYSLLTFLALLTVDRIHNKHKKVLSEIAERIAFNKSNNLFGDLETLISGNIRVRNYAAANFYSKQLLELSEQYSNNSPAQVSDWLLSTDCWLSTTSKGWLYKLLWPFEMRGILALTTDTLFFNSCRISFKVRLSDIKSLSIDHHPAGYRYIGLSFDEAGIERTFFLTPNYLCTDTIRECKNLVNKWYMYLYNAEARHRRKRMCDYSFRPSALSTSEISKHNCPPQSARKSWYGMKAGSNTSLWNIKD